jgi:hypothetical protein
MTKPSNLEARAHDITVALQDYARDLEARLGVISRNRFVNPNEYASMAFAPPIAHVETSDLAVANGSWTENVIERYHSGAGTAATPLDGHDTEENPLTDNERTAFATARDLITSIQSIQSYDDASALVATFN